MIVSRRRCRSCRRWWSRTLESRDWSSATEGLRGQSRSAWTLKAWTLPSKTKSVRSHSSWSRWAIILPTSWLSTMEKITSSYTVAVLLSARVTRRSSAKFILTSKVPHWDNRQEQQESRAMSTHSVSSKSWDSTFHSRTTTVSPRSSNAPIVNMKKSETSWPWPMVTEHHSERKSKLWSSAAFVCLYFV